MIYCTICCVIRIIGSLLFPATFETLRGMTVQPHTLQQSKLVQRSPIFYGWVIWFVATIGVSATAPGQSFSVSLFIDHYIADFGLDRTSVSALYGLGTFLAALSLTWVGRRIDRHGNRLMSVFIALAFGLALMASSLVMGPFTIFISFIAIRGLGQGSLGLVSTTAVAQWFRMRRGRVLALSMMAFAVFQRFYLPWMQSFIEDHGWRAAWLLAGGVMLVFVLPLMGLLFRDRPEDFGLNPDGEDDSNTPEAQGVLEDNWRLSEALRTPILWAFIMGRVLAGAWGTALVFHQISLFDTLGHSPGVAATTYGQAALMTAGFILVAGWLVDRLRPGLVVMIQMLGLIAACVLAMIMTSPALLFVYTAAYGVFMGLGSVFDGTVWVNLFGRQHQGAIRGFVATTGVMGTSIGPIIFGLSYDYLDSYTPALWLGVSLSMIALVLALIVKAPVRRTAA